MYHSPLHTDNFRSINHTLWEDGANPGKEITFPLRRAYELTFIVRLDGDEASVNNTVEQVRSWVETDGQVTKIDRWGRRKLAYEIDKQREGYYVLMYADIEAGTIRELERSLNLSPFVLRHLVVQADK